MFRRGSTRFFLIVRIWKKQQGGRKRKRARSGQPQNTKAAGIFSGGLRVSMQQIR
jgi:hypothetical protein